MIYQDNQNHNSPVKVLFTQPDGLLIVCLVQDYERAVKLLKRDVPIKNKVDKKVLQDTYFVETDKEPKTEGFIIYDADKETYTYEAITELEVFERTDKDLTPVRLSFFQFIIATLKYFFKFGKPLPYSDYLEREVEKSISTQQDSF